MPPCKPGSRRRGAAALVPALLLLPLAWAPAASAAPAAGPVLVPGVPAVLRGSDVSRPSLVRAPARSSLRSSGSQTAATTFQVTYTGFSPAQRDAFQAAVDTWSRLLSSPVPVTIDARLSSLPDGVLGAAGPTAFYVDDADDRYDPSDTAVPIALANSRAGRDLDPGGADISAEFSNDTTLFSYGTDPVASKYDFTTVVLHEIGHGLGFSGAMDVQQDASGVERGYWDPDPEGGTPYPFPFDRETVTPRGDGTVTPLLSLQRGSTALAQALTDGQSQWDGPAGKAANGGVRPELYTPATWEEGSSYSHLDERTYPSGDPDSLMTPEIDLGEVIRDPGSITLGMFRDIGWGAESSSLRLSGPSTARTGTTVAVTGAAPSTGTVRIYFKRRGSTTTSPGAEQGFTLQREIPVGSDLTFSTTFVVNDDYRYYAQIGEQVSSGVLTQARPTFGGAATRVVRRGSSVTLTGRGLPGTRLTLTYQRSGRTVAVRTVTVASDGTWRRSQVLTEDLRVSAQGSNGQRSETTVLLQAR
ncbi:MAG: hypothetical protein JWM64_1865 [Frankiales bacterium]|nr:hypothetical protein [Frankiales bacterium]